MSISKLKQVQKNVDNLIIFYENNNILAPISILEEVQELLQQAEEEINTYYSEIHDESEDD